jgi:hypothetical protein
MAKPKKYPKKFRQKLERMAETRDSQPPPRDRRPDPGVCVIDDTDGLFEKLFKTLNLELLLKGSVDTMHTRVEQNEYGAPRFHTTHTLNVAWTPEYVYGPPPWT